MAVIDNGRGLGYLVQRPRSFVGEHTISVVAPGGLDVTNREPGDTSAIDPAKLEDLLLVFEYRS